MDLNNFSRRKYLSAPTPIEKMERLSEHLGGPEIYIKRDDLGWGFTEGGNKIRKLEFVVADALDQGADTLVTCGAIQSNHCRLTLAAAVKEGLKCRLILEERVPGSFNATATGNNLLYNLLDAEKIRVVPGGSNLVEEMEEELSDLSRVGRKGYAIPLGASYAIGSLGYVICTEEILEQLRSLGLSMDYVVCPSGSGGTHSGLLAGFFYNKSDITVLGFNVGRGREAQEELVFNLTKKLTAKLEMDRDIDRAKVCCFDEYVGPGYSLPTEEMKDAVRLVARLEGIILDPVYTGKAMAGLIDKISKGYFKPDQRVMFIHTGGVTALYAYNHEFL